MSHVLTNHDARERCLNVTRRIEDLKNVLPGLEDISDQLALEAMTPAQLTHSDLLATEKGQKDGMKVMAAWIAKSLIWKQNRERIFKDTDVQAITETFDMLTVMLLSDQIKNINALSDDAFLAARKKWSKITDSTMNSTSQSS